MITLLRIVCAAPSCHNRDGTQRGWVATEEAHGKDPRCPFCCNSVGHVRTDD